jgi:hypothetical protein
MAGQTELVHARTNLLGEFQLELPTGGYELCISLSGPRCTPIDVPTGSRVRADYSFALPGGWHMTPPYTGCD